MKEEAPLQQSIAGRAVIFHNGKVLIIRESRRYQGGTNIGKYDFPGGKVKPGENHIEALKRETLEEAGLKIEVGKPFFVSEWFPEIRGEKVQIIGIFYECTTDNDQVVLSDDHDEFLWIDLKTYANYNLIETNKEALRAYLDA